MTFREKLMIEHPEINIGDTGEYETIVDCPASFGYEKSSKYEVGKCGQEEMCRSECWDREMNVNGLGDTKEKETVNHPSHYNGGVEAIVEMEEIFGLEAVMNFCLLNVWKYRKRAIYKNGEEDMKKADWYCAKYIELKNKFES